MNPLLMLALGIGLGRHFASKENKPDSMKITISNKEWSSLTQGFLSMYFSFFMMFHVNFMNMTDDGAQQAIWSSIALGAATAAPFLIFIFQLWWQGRMGTMPFKAIWLSAGFALASAAVVWWCGPTPVYITCDYTVDYNLNAVRQCTPPGLSMWIWLLLDLIPVSVFAVASPIVHATMLRFSRRS